MDSKILVYIIIILIVGFTLVIGIGVATRSAIEHEPEHVETEPVTVRDGPGRDDVVHYNAPSTHNLAGFRKIQKKVDNIAETRTEQANEALGLVRDDR